MHPLMRQWAEVQRQLRLKKIYQGLRCKEARPRYIFHGLSRYELDKRRRKTKAVFVPGLGMRSYRPIFGASPATYYLRANGTAATYDLATGPGSSQGDCMSIATHDAAGDVYLAGDVLKACADGGIFRDQLDFQSSGSNGNNIIYEPESGDSPIFYGSNAVATWADQGSNKWKASEASEPTRVWFIETDGSISWGVEVADTDALAAEYDWVWDSNELWCFAASDPDSRYSSVEGSQRLSCMLGNTKDYIIIQDGIEFAFAKDQGIYNYHGDGWLVDEIVAHHIGVKGNAGRGVHLRDGSSNTISNSTIHNIGVSGAYPTSADGGNCDNNIVESNIFYDIYHSAIDFLRFDSGSGTGAGNIARYNEVYHTSNYDNNYTSNAVFFKGGSGMIFTNPQIYCNLAYGMYEYDGEGTYILDQYITGAEIFNNVAAKSLGASVRLGFAIRSSVSNITGVILKNNIGYDMAGRALQVADKDSVSECDNNCWYNTSGEFARVDSVDYDGTEFAEYKAASGFDANGLWEDPDFLAPASNNYHLKTESPCIEAGVVIAGLTKDKDGVPLGRGTNPDIGCFETLKGGPRRL